jgi:sugar/nucleoside kinase (ribokinase family)
VTDFAQGLLSRGVLTRLCKRVRRKADVMVGDVSGRRGGLASMRSMDLLCPSESELRSSMNRFDESLPTVTWRLLEESGAQAAIVTMGAEGLVVFERRPGAATDTDPNASRVNGEHVPALCPIGIDPLGCGDALAATAALTLASGGSHLAAGFLGAVAAAAQVQRLGNMPVSGADLRRGVARVHASVLAYAGPDLADAATIRASQESSTLGSALRAS